jgi:glycosyltransferase involved in cell wall biosynthesis
MISVCIATYNGEEYVEQQLKSILIQLSKEDEIIVSDDGSKDNTVKIIEGLNDKRIKVYLNGGFKNPIYNFERALSLSNGNFIFLSDQDDLWHPDKISVMKKHLLKYDMVVCDHSMIDIDNNLIEKSYFKRVKSKSGIIHNLKKNTYYGCCMAFRKELLKIALPFPEKIPMHDIWLGFVTDLFFKAKFVDYPYTLYRKHSNNASNATEKISNYPLSTKIMNRINILRYTPKLLIRKFKNK